MNSTVSIRIRDGLSLEIDGMYYPAEPDSGLDGIWDRYWQDGRIVITNVAICDGVSVDTVIPLKSLPERQREIIFDEFDARVDEAFKNIEFGIESDAICSELVA